MTGAVPVELSVTGCVSVVLIVTFPNVTLGGLTVSVGVPATACTVRVLSTGDFCAALGLRMPTTTARVPAPSVTVLCSWEDDKNTVVTSPPDTSSCEPETKFVPCTFNRKVDPGVVCVIEPEENVGSGFRTLTLSVADETGVAVVFTPIVTECPAHMLEDGEYRPELVIGPVVVFPLTNPFTNHTTAESAAPFTTALYCPLPPSRTSVGPTIEI